MGKNDTAGTEETVTKTYPNGNTVTYRGTVPGGKYILFYDYDMVHGTWKLDGVKGAGR